VNFLGIDIGGTKMAVCIGDENGNVQVDQRFPTDANDPQTTLARAAEIAEKLIEKAGCWESCCGGKNFADQFDRQSKINNRQCVVEAVNDE